MIVVKFPCSSWSTVVIQYISIGYSIMLVMATMRMVFKLEYSLSDVRILVIFW